MLLAAYVIEKEREKARAEGLKEGIKEGRANGYKDADEQLAGYFRRMDSARAAGEDFDEPRPRFRRNGR